jgi:hypothetical protein
MQFTTEPVHTVLDNTLKKLVPRQNMARTFQGTFSVVYTTNSV